ncbi:bifunctional diguanylate cyclase/phosphodiesterase [Caballeronia sp. SBC2]|uniref:putative bifunctional diguanylate cyclase/phosphodiesterase n=1 Tax=Caballeronia sp. SBC2 TaxID=2705547 RepID=UPI0013E1E130|nr:EAL domain-containing protein [Caballeronia sp. SBC2]QIE29316.1 EAL domain protein [Caballeronia sp. SBC2]
MKQPDVAVGDTTSEQYREGTRAAELKGSVSRRTQVLTVLAVVFILSAIALNTVLAMRQTQEQNDALAALQASSRVKHNLDALQQLLFDEHAELYTRVGTRPFYTRAPYTFPLDQVTALTQEAREGCKSRASCIGHLDELNRMVHTLSEQSEALAARVSLHPGSVKLSDPALAELDAFFYSVVAKVIEIRMEADAVVDATVSRATFDTKRTSSVLLGSALSASLILVALLLRNARSAQRLRLAWRVADTARADLFRSKQTLEYVLDHIPHGIAWKDAEHRYGGGNEVYARDAGLNSRAELIGLTDWALRWGDDPRSVQIDDIQVMAGSLGRKHFEREVIAVDGSKQWISETKLPLIAEDGAVAGVLTAYENITSRRQAELALRLQSRALDASVNGIVITEPRGDTHFVLYANAAFERITGYAKDEVVGVGCDVLFGIAGEPKKWDPVREALDQNIEANVTLRCLKKDGEPFWNNVLVAPVRDGDGRVTHHVGVMSDVTALVNYQSELQHQAHYDGLTGLPNRAALEGRLNDAIVRARDSGGEVSVMFLDLDRFKQVNDSLGHRVGDAVLAQMAERLRRVIRSADLVARYGGDEFMVVAERPSGAQLGPMVARLLASMAEPLRVSEQELYVEVSIGISTFPHDGIDADTLIRNADAAMYLAKESGRNGFQYYRSELNRAAADKLTLSTKLRRAVNAEALHIDYQPQIDMVTGRLCGAEALLRWSDSELGNVAPAIFIPLAEEIGLVSKLGDWVLRAACSQARVWLDEGLDCVRMSVNVSPLQLERSDLVKTVCEALDAARLPASMLELELTEGALMRDPDEVASVLRDLRKLGVTIAIDDFGTGYSSLSYLKRFSIDRIKIDRAFVHEIGNDTEYEALTLAVIAMADALKFDVIAEGVETDVQQRFLVEHGCIKGQGFLFSPAVSASRFAELAAVQPALI